MEIYIVETMVGGVYDPFGTVCVTTDKAQADAWIGWRDPLDSLKAYYGTQVWRDGAFVRAYDSLKGGEMTNGNDGIESGAVARD